MIKVKSKAFTEGQNIPAKYTCDGADISPQLSFQDVPIEALTLAIIMDDPDAPSGTFVHWVLYNLPATTKELAENFPDEETLEDGTRQGINDFGSIGYGGPCPPPGKPHRYYFKVYALDNYIDTNAVEDKSALLTAMKGHIIAEGQLMGKYQRHP